MKRYLVLENGSIYSGEAFGSNEELLTEVVFSTGMTGYQETMTDPSYFGQSMVFTYPLIGNYGINLDDNEGSRPAVDAIVAKEITKRPSNFRSVMSIPEYAKENGVVGIEGVDTRKLAKELRTQGSMKGVLVNSLDETKIQELFAQDYDQLLVERSKKEEYVAGNGKVKDEGAVRIALIDFGLKNSIAQALEKRGVNVLHFDWTTDIEKIREADPDGVLLSNGPGNPELYEASYPMILALQDEYPLLGICLGHQLFALANGAKTYKMKFGYRGFNHAVWDVDKQEKHFTSQNHGYAVDRDSVKDTKLEVTHEEINQNTVEGVRLNDRTAFSVQFHPDACPGPHDSEYIFDKFLAAVKDAKKEPFYAKAN
ncbi:carbamoyl phosphate synthase small subunit [Fructobacillus sp. M2-14]|uniref:Carbamoyl phosphate synthase small chain n=1 Tax=Fructobacillus broussonetiae TaxID=2713173 RepID=A0ABS5QY49_9LACO|nr:carbamoyl phosphate synthase small subunit [Fructobacillus broussonetiae]MBS9338128.1 carbamoyl phosphate synthase small subunit [Fructobacillus broussonetiae]